MQRTLLKSKLHGAVVTSSHLHYQGSLGIDETLMQAADIVEGEMVHVYNVTNGERLTTYAIRQPAGSGAVRVFGAAARLIAEKDKLLILTYAQYDDTEQAAHRPIIVLLGPDNTIECIKHEN